MIATHIAKAPDIADNYTQLGKYIAAAREKGEKLDKLWMVNCDAGDGPEDLDTALAEIEAVRKMRPEIKNKSYHLVVSFHPGEKDRLSAEDLKDIERAFAEALGFADHQRVAGTHINTDHFHMHVAYNRVHPETLKVTHPFRDYRALERTARALERRYGLHVDPGMSDYRDRPKGSQKARAYEAHTWQQSFQNHVLDRREDLLGLFGKARSWQALHKGLADQGIVLKRRGNGLVLAEADGPQTMKASLLDRNASLPALQKRLGAFEPLRDRSSGAPAPPPQRPRRAAYKARPLLRHPATSKLWRRYLGQKATLPSQGLLGRMAANWKLFLLMEAHQDPLAFVLIMAHLEMLDTVFGGAEPTPRAPRPPRPAPVPSGLREALDHWKAAGAWATPGRLPWLAAKGPAGRGCRIDDAGNLLVPFRDADGRLRGLRVLSPDGAALDLGELTGTRHVIDPERRLDVGSPVAGAGAVVLTTDYAMATAIQAATETPVIVVPAETALAATAAALRKTHPGVTAVVAEIAPARPSVEPPREMRWDEAEALGAFQDDALDIEDVLADQAPVGVESGGPDSGRTVSGLPVVSVPADAKAMEVRIAFARETGDRSLLAWSEAAAWATPANAPWLKASGIRGYGVKLAADGGLLIPLKDRHGRLRDVLRLDAATGAPSPMIGAADGPPLRHVIDPERRFGKDTLVVATDYASAAALHRATRLPVVLAGTPERWPEVAEELRQRYPDECLVIALDAGAGPDAGPAAEETARRLRATVVRPDAARDGAEAPPTRQPQGRALDRAEAEALGAFEDDALGIEDVLTSRDGLNPVTTTPIRSFGDMAAAGLDTALRETLAPAIDDRALLLWTKAHAPTDGAAHPWLAGLDMAARKDLREDDAGNLLVPFRDTAGRLWAVQAVSPTGEAAAPVGQDRPDAFYGVGGRPGAKPGPVIVAADHATARALHRLTGRPVALATGDETLQAVAKAVRRRHPDRPIVIAATDTHMAKRNESLALAEAATKAVGGTLLRPPLDDAAKKTGMRTFGDLAATHDGMPAIRKALQATDLIPTRSRPLTAE